MMMRLIGVATTAGALASAIVPGDRTTTLNLRKHNHYRDDPKGESPPRDGTTHLGSVPITNRVNYYGADIMIGGAVHSLLVDTGSSITWCGARFACQPTSSGIATGQNITVTYGSGSFSGKVYTDDVTVANQTAKSLLIGAAEIVDDFNIYQSFDGILGLGRKEGTKGAIEIGQEILTYMDVLHKQETIQDQIFGVHFLPATGNDEADTNGHLTIGGIDETKFIAPVHYIPTATEGSAQYKWGLATEGFSYGSAPLSGPNTGFVDTGVSSYLLPNDTFHAFMLATRGSVDLRTGFATFMEKPTQNLTISLGGAAFPLTPEQYLIPEEQLANQNYTGDAKYVANIIGNESPEFENGLNFVIGMPFLEAYYSVFDTTNSRIGFAPNRSPVADA